MILRLALRSPKSAKATRLSSRVRRSVTSCSVTVSLNVHRDSTRVGRVQTSTQTRYAARRAELTPARGAPRSRAAAGQTDGRGGDQALRPDAAPAGAGRLPLGSRADAGDAGPLSGRGDLRGGRRA